MTKAKIDPGAEAWLAFVGGDHYPVARAAEKWRDLANRRLKAGDITPSQAASLIAVTEPNKSGMMAMHHWKTQGLPRKHMRHAMELAIECGCYSARQLLHFMPADPGGER